MCIRDRNTIEYYKIPSAVLMERAALAVSDEIKKQFKDPSQTNTILSICGCGNNGGDGLAVARHVSYTHLDVYKRQIIHKDKMYNCIQKI